MTAHQIEYSSPFIQKRSCMALVSSHFLVIMGDFILHSAVTLNLVWTPRINSFFGHFIHPYQGRSVVFFNFLLWFLPYARMFANRKPIPYPENQYPTKLHVDVTMMDKFGT